MRSVVDICCQELHRAPPPPSSFSSSSSPPLNLSLRERQYPALNIPNLELQIHAKGASSNGINHILSLMASETRLTLALSHRRYGG
ncbi:hypothetical protein QQF64_010654 [Cirrhinus molitorella]|uniref:Uncharacterized protein n=1 Tax=Cirrhinus molitorella TaxID=172907 RepID=A0ABR3LYN2_9TELE